MESGSIVLRYIRNVDGVLRLWRFLQFQRKLILHTLRGRERFHDSVGVSLLEFYSVFKLGRNSSFGADELDSCDCVLQWNAYQTAWRIQLLG